MRMAMQQNITAVQRRQAAGMIAMAMGGEDQVLAHADQAIFCLNRKI